MSNQVVNEVNKEDFNQINRNYEEARAREAELELYLKEEEAKNVIRASRMRKQKISQGIIRCAATALTMWALYHAQTAGLIASVLSVPAYCVGFTFCGWCLCDVSRYWKLERQARGRC